MGQGQTDLMVITAQNEVTNSGGRHVFARNDVEEGWSKVDVHAVIHSQAGRERYL
jgi:hypothetical protein